MKKRIISFFLIAILLSCKQSVAQVKFKVSANQLLDADKSLYLATSYNDWNPADESLKLKKDDDGNFTIILENLPQLFEYKYTQGSWDMVEGNLNGTNIQNRLYKSSSSKTQNDTIVGWEKRYEYVIHIVKLPQNTPIDASLFITGNFNDWKIEDLSFRAKKLSDGTFRFTIFSDLDEIVFKIHRGNWESVEGKKNGRSIPNHIINRSELRANKNIEIEIQSWEDLQSSFSYYSIFDLLLLFAAFHGFLLSITIPSIQDFNRNANKWLVYLLIIASFLTFFRVTGNFREVANLFPKLVLFPQFIFFSFSPIFYLYIRKLLFEEKFDVSDKRNHFIPLVIQMIVFMPFFMLDGKIFQYKVVNEELDLIALYFITWASGLIYNFYYLNKSKRLVFEYEKGYLNETAHHQDIKYLRTVIQIQFVCLIVTLLSAVLFVMRYFWGNIHDEVVENCINMAWLVFSFIGYILGYYAINQPEIFKVNEEILSDPEISSNDSLKIKGSDETLKSVELDPTLHQLKMDLLHYFNEGKPYLNNNLTINDLSDYFDVPVLSISKAINQGFNKNFFDFVNTYRVNEFKKQLRDPKNKNLTLLGIAYGVGFNSKTSFNRAFKKITSQTPSEYIQGLEL